jgi:hypothetical protein
VETQQTFSVPNSQNELTVLLRSPIIHQLSTS